MNPVVENPLDPAALHDRFGDLHDSVVRRVDVRYATSGGHTATIEMDTPDRARGEFQIDGKPGRYWHWVKLTFEPASVTEYRAGQRFNALGWLIFEARLARLEDDWWLCLDDAPFNPGEGATIEQARQSEFYIRCTDLEIRWSSLDEHVPD